MKSAEGAEFVHFATVLRLMSGVQSSLLTVYGFTTDLGSLLCEKMRIIQNQMEQMVNN